MTIGEMTADERREKLRKDLRCSRPLSILVRFSNEEYRQMVAGAKARGYGPSDFYDYMRDVVLLDAQEALSLIEEQALPAGNGVSLAQARIRPAGDTLRSHQPG